jgi:hypothetical protein
VNLLQACVCLCSGEELRKSGICGDVTRPAETQEVSEEAAQLHEIREAAQLKVNEMPEAAKKLSRNH